MKTTHLHRYLPAILSLLLFLALLTVFGPVSGHDFLNYDDNIYVTDNDHVQGGITYEGIRWALTSTEAGFWHPLTWLSLMADFTLYGLNAGGYHWTNVIIHVASTLLLFAVLRRMTGSFYRSVFVAALFALHPLHVEPVAWISARKDVLSALFWMLTMWFYVGYVERPNLWRYLLVILSFIMGLMSKPMVATLPFVLLLLDYWPLGRFSTSSVFRLVLEKIPLVLMAALVMAVTYAAEQKMGALISLEAFPLDVRIFNALISYAVYIGKTILPTNLAVFYPHPGNWPIWQVVLSGIFLLCVTCSVLYFSRRFPYLFVGWFWYLGTLVPVIGLIQIGSHAMADRYTYLPLIGIFIIAGWGGAELFRHGKYHRCLLTFTVLLIFCLFSWVSALQVGYWKDSITLFRHALDVADKSYLPYYNLGIALREKGETREAIVNFKKALELSPDMPSLHNNLGVTLIVHGDLSGAADEFRQTICLNQDHAGAHNNLALTLYRQGQFDMAANHFRKAIHLQPDFANAHYYLALILARKGLTEESLRYYGNAVRISPVYGSGHFQQQFLINN